MVLYIYSRSLDTGILVYCSVRMNTVVYMQWEPLYTGIYYWRIDNRIHLDGGSEIPDLGFGDIEIPGFMRSG